MAVVNMKVYIHQEAKVMTSLFSNFGLIENRQTVNLNPHKMVASHPKMKKAE